MPRPRARPSRPRSLPPQPRKRPRTTASATRAGTGAMFASPIGGRAAIAIAMAIRAAATAAPSGEADEWPARLGRAGVAARHPFPPASFGGCAGHDARGGALSMFAAAAIVAGRNAHSRETDMPEIYAHAVKGRTLDQKRALVKDITDAVVKNFSVPVEAVTVEIVESEPTAKAKGGVLFSEMRR